jgi:hypothetical protein
MSNKLLRNIRDEQEQWNDGQTREEAAAHLKACEGVSLCRSACIETLCFHCAPCSLCSACLFV